MKDYISKDSDSKPGGAWIVVKKETLRQIYTLMCGTISGMGVMLSAFGLLTSKMDALLAGVFYILIGIVLAYVFVFRHR